MSKVGWSFFSRRRKITPELLVRKGSVFDYDSFLAYCQGLDVVPLKRQEFETEFSAALDAVSSQAALSPSRISTCDLPGREEEDISSEPEVLKAVNSSTPISLDGPAQSTIRESGVGDSLKSGDKNTSSQASCLHATVWLAGVDTEPSGTLSESTTTALTKKVRKRS